jgi:hypothetical protein
MRIGISVFHWVQDNQRSAARGRHVRDPHRPDRSCRQDKAPPCNPSLADREARSSPPSEAIAEDPYREARLHTRNPADAERIGPPVSKIKRRKTMDLMFTLAWKSSSFPLVDGMRVGAR